MIDGQLLIVTANACQGFVEGRLSFLTFVFQGIVILEAGIVIAVHVLVPAFSSFLPAISFLLQGRVVVHFSIDTFHQLRDGQLHQLRY